MLTCCIAQDAWQYMKDGYRSLSFLLSQVSSAPLVSTDTAKRKPDAANVSVLMQLTAISNHRTIDIYTCNNGILVNPATKYTYPNIPDFYIACASCHIHQRIRGGLEISLFLASCD